MDNPKLCRSCSGPLSDYKPEEIIKDGFCPYCVDKRGNLKCYDEVLKGMLDYIQSDHPEISQNDRKPTAEKWLLEGEVWGQVFKGCIIEESLENKDLLKLCKITQTKVEKDDNPKTNAGEPIWTLHQVEVTRAKIEKVVSLLSKNLKLPNWWADLSFKDEVYIVFRNKVFNGSNKDKSFVKSVRDYGNSVKLPQSQIPLS